MDPEDMPKLNLAKDAAKLSTSDRHYIKKIEEFNVERVARLKKLNRNNRIVGGLLGLTVISIYAYTINAVKQERFLDDFEVPQTTTEKQ
ncbi:hypothetical protein PV326_002930 [Microctonus aethiopoides]|uniref:Cytochrome c oxidase assembly factor 3 n=1 Tax=Microctonus aethiopoides TaxID=144406 RepID=A0AA39C671_9HYME|nr:hypothetical protein PV326_002930 [Microctonus aethiopoides]KAK0158344.1 hypothetical protein PV328_009358 [Microctonus aethiopoides]